MVEFLSQSRLLVGCERAADLRQHLGWGDRVRPPVLTEEGKQKITTM